MLEIALIIALLGLSVAGTWDLLTTEVPDEVPYLMIVLGIFVWYANALTIGDFMPLFYSLLFGALSLTIGLLMYKQGAWGGADAWLLGATAFLLPIYNGNVFIFDFVFNLLIVGSVYMIVYSIVLGFMNPYVAGIFYKDMKGNAKFIVPPLFLAAGFAFYEPRFSIPLALIASLIIFWRYARVIEQHVFRRKIKSRELKPGDVTEDMIWRGITPHEITELRKKKKYVIIKEGVRFVPAFPMTLVVTLLYGNLLTMLIAL
jgi:Flp pilus assembly protein protease CpaA